LTIFTRLDDGAVLDTDLMEGTEVLNAEGIYGYKFDRSFAQGNLGEAIPVSSVLSQKVFTLNFSIADTTSSAQKLIERYFSKTGWYRLEGGEFREEAVDFVVVDVQPSFFAGSDTLAVTCQSKYGDRVKEVRDQIHNEWLNDGAAFGGWSGSVFNYSEHPSEILLSLKTAFENTWVAGTDVTILGSNGGRVSARIGRTLPDGTLTFWKGNAFTLGSDREVIDGKGVILPIRSQFFTVYPGETVTITVNAFGSPIQGSDDIQLTVELVTVNAMEGI
jgi:hypothetical protein